MKRKIQTIVYSEVLISDLVDIHDLPAGTLLIADNQSSMFIRDGENILQITKGNNKTKKATAKPKKSLARALPK